MLTTVLSTSGRTTSRIGLGLATLMREPSKQRRFAVLETAYRLGIRHFDVAPLYGLGIAEPELGEFLSVHAVQDVTVATKFGLTPSRKAQMVAPVQGPLRAAMRRSEALRRLGKSAEGSVGAVASLPPSMLATSVAQSLERLRLDRLDVLILHEVAWSTAWAEVWPDIASTPAYAGLGVSGTTALFADYPETALRSIPFTQGPVSTLRALPLGPQRSHHSVLNLHGPQVAAAVVGLPASERRALRDMVGGDLDAGAVRALALASLLTADGSCLVQVGTTNPQHLENLIVSVRRLADHSEDNEGLRVLRSLASAGAASSGGL